MIIKNEYYKIYDIIYKLGNLVYSIGPSIKKVL